MLGSKTSSYEEIRMSLFLSRCKYTLTRDEIPSVGLMIPYTKPPAWIKKSDATASDFLVD